MQQITKKQCLVLCEELGFQLNFNRDEVLSYEEIFKSIELGSQFDQICKSMDLETSLVKNFIIKYVFHLLLEEAASFTELDKKVIREYFEEPLINSTIGEIFEEIQDELFFIRSDTFQEYLTNIVDIQKSIFVASINKEDDNFFDPVYPFNKKSYSLFTIYFNYFVNKKRPIKPQSIETNKMDSKDFFKDIFIHLNQYNKLISGYDKKNNPTREILEFERETNIFFLLKIHSILPKEKINKMSSKRKKNYLKALASMTLIEDIRLKLYFVEQFVVEDNEFIFTKSYEGYIRLFWLIFLYIPLLKELIKNQLKAPKGALSVKDPFLNDKEDSTQLRRIKKKLFLYYTLKNNLCYQITDIKSEDIFQINNLEYTNDFDDLYKEIKKLKNIREKFCKESIENIINEINKNVGFSDKFDYLFLQQAKSLATCMSLKIDQNKKMNETLKIYNEFIVSEEKITQKLNQLNFEKFSKKKK